MPLQPVSSELEESSGCYKKVVQNRYLTIIDPERGVFGLKPSGNIITEGNISPNTPSGGSINVILYRKTKMFMQNLKHKRVHTLLSVLTHDIL